MTQGKKLMLLVKGSSKTQGEIANEIGYTSTHLGRMYSKDVLPEKLKTTVIAYFKLNDDYFEDIADEDCEKQVERLKAQVSQKDLKIMELQDELIKVQKYTLEIEKKLPTLIEKIIELRNGNFEK